MVRRSLRHRSVRAVLRSAIDDAINLAIQEGKLPGAVLLIGHDGKVVYRKGLRQAGAGPAAGGHDPRYGLRLRLAHQGRCHHSAVMKLFEQGRFRLNDKITDYIPEFQGGKSDITIRNLLTHFSGLQPDVPLGSAWSGYQHGIELANTFKPARPPATRYVYSDINFLLLASSSTASAGSSSPTTPAKTSSCRSA